MLWSILIISCLLIIIFYLSNQVEGFENEGFIFYTPSDSITKSLTDILYTPDKTYDFKIETSPIPGLRKQNEKCLMATEPKYIPTDGHCGWWYNQDNIDYIPSFGQLGTRNGPNNFDNVQNSYPNGEYVWDLNEAQKMEDAKICKRLKICEQAGMNPTKCGFCPSLNYGVPIDIKGQNLYENILGLTCPENPVTNSNKCPRPLEAYNSVNEPQICDPDSLTGKLSNPCLLRLAKAFDFPDYGVVIKILSGDIDGYMKTGTKANFKFNKVISVLKEELNIITNNAFFGLGVCMRNQVIDYYYALKKAVYQKKSEKASKAAEFLIHNKPFDECYKRPDETGPFDLPCVQRIAFKYGASVPEREDDIARFEDKHWAYVHDYYKRRGTASHSLS